MRALNRCAAPSISRAFQYYRKASDESRVLLRAIWPFVRRSKTLLDIGAGTGDITRELAVARRIIAIEANSENAAQLKKNIGGGSHVVVCDRIENIELDEASIDAVVCIHALYYISDFANTLSRIFTWLKHGGVAVLIVLAEQGDQSALIKKYWKGYHPGSNLPRPSSRELIKAVQRHSRKVRIQRVSSYCRVKSSVDKWNLLSFALDVSMSRLSRSTMAQFERALARERPYSRRGRVSTIHDIVIAWR